MHSKTCCTLAPQCSLVISACHLHLYSTYMYVRVYVHTPPILSESEELLAKISTTQFTHLAVTSDLSQLAVTTNSKYILLVNLPDYFEVILPMHV